MLYSCSLQVLHRQIDDSTNETNELRKQLLAESQARAQSDEMLNEAREQLQIHQQLSARSADQVMKLGHYIHASLSVNCKICSFSKVY